MGEPDDPPALPLGSRKIWVTLAAVEFAIILILAAGLAHFASHREGEPGRAAAAAAVAWGPPAGGGKWTLQTATEHWRACWNHTKTLEANTSALSAELVRLNTHLQRKELDIQALEGERSVLKNWTRKLEELNIQQREIITHFHQRQKLWSGASPLHNAVALWIAMAMAGTLLL